MNISIRALMCRIIFGTLAATTSLAVADLGVAEASTILDAKNDFLPTFDAALPHNGDLDVEVFSARASTSDLFLTGKFGADVGTTTGSIYVFGIDRGSHANSFASIGFPGVTFDATAVVKTTGLGTGTAAVGGTALDASRLKIDGDTITLDIPLTLLPSTGFASVFDYLVDLWPRVGLGNNAQIADFAADRDISTVAEPATVTLFGLALTGLAWRRRNRTMAHQA